MTDFDSKISAVLSAEDELLLKEMGDESGYFQQVFGLFRGPMSWFNWVIMFVQSIMFLAGIWMAWHFFHSSDPVAQLHWGLPAMTLVIGSAMLKFSLVPVMQANRILREIRRIELLRNR